MSIVCIQYDVRTEKLRSNRMELDMKIGRLWHYLLICLRDPWVRLTYVVSVVYLAVRF